MKHYRSSNVVSLAIVFTHSVTDNVNAVINHVAKNIVQTVSKQSHCYKTCQIICANVVRDSSQHHLAISAFLQHLFIDQVLLLLCAAQAVFSIRSCHDSVIRHHTPPTLQFYWLVCNLRLLHLGSSPVGSDDDSVSPSAAWCTATV